MCQRIASFNPGNRLQIRGKPLFVAKERLPPDTLNEKVDPE